MVGLATHTHTHTHTWHGYILQKGLQPIVHHVRRPLVFDSCSFYEEQCIVHLHGTLRDTPHSMKSSVLYIFMARCATPYILWRAVYCTSSWHVAWYPSFYEEQCIVHLHGTLRDTLHSMKSSVLYIFMARCATPYMVTVMGRKVKVVSVLNSLSITPKTHGEVLNPGIRWR
jgi:hypothetical protein